ncbi:subtilisin-like protease SBT1.2 [Panicum miliaceum]|uniref:Subtilisin-like protease SBT1.2 n=1 Tax=Panicum miliaceum TaxID=4540 RepID=A0A3L6RQ04_PANMI|nr:subtilisin-like protease SBT1.2 [Panicum miliaceum]
MDPAKIALLFALSSTLLAAAAAYDDGTLTSNMGEGVVIGVLDDGIDAGHPSFGDEGMPPPPPARWRGRCKHPGVAACNNKLVGAREFTRHLRRPAGRAPRAGTHGTHASSIAAGAPVRRADGGAVIAWVSEEHAVRSPISISARF